MKTLAFLLLWPLLAAARAPATLTLDCGGQHWQLLCSDNGCNQSRLEFGPPGGDHWRGTAAVPAEMAAAQWFPRGLACLTAPDQKNYVLVAYGEALRDGEARLWYYLFDERGRVLNKAEPPSKTDTAAPGANHDELEALLRQLNLDWPAEIRFLPAH